jgi:hypothetical protein
LNVKVVYKWTQALLEATENLKTNTDKLSKAKDVHGLKQRSDGSGGSRKKSGLRKSSLNHSQLLSTAMSISKDDDKLDKSLKKMSGA